MLRNFLFDICGLTGNFTIQGREEQCLKYIKDTVGNNKVTLESLTLSRLQVCIFLGTPSGQWWCRQYGVCRVISQGVAAGSSDRHPHRQRFHEEEREY